jgi:autoinducer 2-degrading protein
MPAIALVVEIRTHPGQRDALLARLRQHRANVLAHEPGCQRFEILLAEEEADTLVLYELYRDDDALKDHDAAHYFQAYREDTAAMIASRRRILCRPAND